MSTIIIINFLLYLIPTLYYRKKYPRSIFYYFWLYFTIFTGASVFVVLTGIYEMRFYNLNQNTHFSLTPYLFNFISIYLLLYPFTKLNGVELRKNQEIQKLSKYINYICILMYIYIIVKFLEYQIFSSYSIMERREISVGLDDSFDLRKTNPFLWYADFILWMLHEITTPLLLTYAIHLLIIKKNINKQFISILICVALPPFITSINASNRASLFFLFFNTVFFLTLYLKYLPKRVLKILWQYGFIISIPIIIFLTLITLARAESSSTDAEIGLWSYFGESFVNLGTFIYEQNDRFTYGARLFPVFFNFLTGISFDIDSGIANYYDFWTSYTGVYVHIFKSLFGDLYLEFGTFVALLFMFILCIIVTFTFKNRHINSYFKTSIVYLYICFCTVAVFEFYRSYGGLFPIRYIIASFIFYSLLGKKIKSTKQ